MAAGKTHGRLFLYAAHGAARRAVSLYTLLHCAHHPLACEGGHVRHVARSGWRPGFDCTAASRGTSSFVPDPNLRFVAIKLPFVRLDPVGDLAVVATLADSAGRAAPRRLD